MDAYTFIHTHNDGIAWIDVYEAETLIDATKLAYWNHQENDEIIEIFPVSAVNGSNELYIDDSLSFWHVNPTTLEAFEVE